MLKWDGEREPPCLFADLSGKMFSFSPFILILSVDFLRCLYQVLSSSFTERFFNHK